MDAMTDVHNLHSYVLLFLCLNKCGILPGMNKISDPGQG